MAFGIDTFRSHLDLIPTIYPGGDFFAWNEGTRPVFAGRNFLGGDFLWGHGEATNALQNPSPEDLENLIVSVPLIAPIQAPVADRQQVTGSLGYLYGEIDASAICNRLKAGILSGELNRPEGGLVHVWLSVDPAVPFSVDYWAGWSDGVNNFSWSQFIMIHIGGFVLPMQPFRACILCNFSIGITGRLQPDAQVIAAIATSASRYRGSNTTCYALWADAEARPPLDWRVFSGTTMPELWRFSRGFRNDAGAVVNDLFNVDAVNPGLGMGTATNFMLVNQQWQPNVPSILNFGFIVSLEPPGNTAITNAQITNIQANLIPSFRELGGHYTLPGGEVRAVGRYLRTPGHGHSIGRDEAERLSNAGFQIFTIWESVNVLAGGDPSMGPNPWQIGIRYFDPAFHAGTEDGINAFTYCGDVLRQPPHTPVFFCVDFDAADPGDTAPVSTADSRQRIRDYFTLIKRERDAYARRNPDRHYLIGLYGNGEVNRWCYEQGIVSMFWQSTSPGGTGNVLPRRPWYHGNRWQFNREAGLAAAGWNHVPGADPDVDWGDGGTWSLAGPLAQELEQWERLGIILSGVTFGNWGNLVIPPPPLP